MSHLQGYHNFYASDRLRQILINKTYISTRFPLSPMGILISLSFTAGINDFGNIYIYKKSHPCEVSGETYMVVLKPYMFYLLKSVSIYHWRKNYDNLVNVTRV